jgi:hypothetical protein
LGDIEQSPSLSPLSKEIGTILCEASAQLILMASPPPLVTDAQSSSLHFKLHTHTHATKNKENGGGGKKKEISNREDET